MLTGGSVAITPWVLLEGFPVLIACEQPDQLSGTTIPWLMQNPKAAYNNGNLTTDENNYRFVYDAWNKVVQVKNSSNVVSSPIARMP